MKNLFAVLIAAAFGVASIGAFAASHSGGAPMKDDALAKACKDKKPGDEVTVGGKKEKCPAPAAAKK